MLKKYEGTYNMSWISEPDEGQSQAINKGFKMAKGQIFGWLNSDDCYLTGAVSTSVDVLNQNPEIDLVYSYVQKINENNEVTKVLKSPEFDRNLLFSNPNVIHQQTVFFRGNLLEKVGYLDENLHFAMDYDLWLRMARVGNFKLIPKVLASYRFSSDSKSVTFDQKFWPEVDQILRKNGVHGISPVYLAFHKSVLIHKIWSYLRCSFLTKIRNRLFGFWETDD